MTGWTWALLGAAAAFGLAALGDLISEEIRGWLDLAPRAVLRLAATQLPPTQRVTIYYDEWLPELCYVLRGAESRPITRLIRGTNFAIGLLISARRIARTITRTPQAPATGVIGVQTETFQVRLSYHGRRVDITDEVKAKAAQLGMSVEKLIDQPDWLNRLSSTVTAGLPIGEPIQIAHEQRFIPIMSGARLQGPAPRTAAPPGLSWETPDCGEEVPDPPS